jgi:hypothetical protein
MVRMPWGAASFPWASEAWMRSAIIKYGNVSTVPSHVSSSGEHAEANVVDPAREATTKGLIEEKASSTGSAA